MPKLVCLMPLFNHVDLLEKSVMSVMMQKTNFDYKLIIIDDCSTDGSYELALELEKKYKNIAVYRNHENLRLLRSIYNGYNYLKGVDYFCVLDPDDWYTSADKFQIAIDFLEKHKNYSMYMNNIIVFQEQGENFYIDSKIDSFDFDFEDYKKGKKTVYLQTSGVVYRNFYFKYGYDKSFSKILDYPFPQSFRSDGFRWFWYLKKGPAYFCNIPKSVYNYNGQGIWSSMKELDRLFSNVELLIGCSQFFKEDYEFFQKNATNELINSLAKFNCIDCLDKNLEKRIKKLIRFIDFFKRESSLFEIIFNYFIEKIYSFFILINYKKDKYKNKIVKNKVILVLKRLNRE